MAYDPNVALLPYQFEPEWNDEQLDNMAGDDFGENQVENQVEVMINERLVDVTTWCQCDNCTIMPTVRECQCCSEEGANVTDSHICDSGAY